MKLWHRKTVRIGKAELEELRLHNLRLVESNEVLLDDVRELQGQLADAREHEPPEFLLFHHGVECPGHRPGAIPAECPPLVDSGQEAQ